MKNNLRNLYVSVVGVLLSISLLVSCQKENLGNWEESAQEAVFLGYHKSDECSTGYLFNFLNDNTDNKVKLARYMPSHVDESIFKFFPLKVKIIYDIKEESCSSVQELIRIKDITVIQ